MALSHILSRRGGPSNSIKEETNKPLKKSPSYFGRLASFSLLRKKSSVSIRKHPITIRRIYTEDEMVNFELKNSGNAVDGDEYGIDEILSPYSDDVSDICTYIERTSEMSSEQRERKLRYEESIECSTVELENITEDALDIRQRSKESTKENETPSAGSSIFEKANSLMFEDDAISHSTSKYSFILSKQNDTENYNALDFVKNEQYIDTGSINDANIEVFKTPANKLNVKLVSRSPILRGVSSSSYKPVSPMRPILDLKDVPNNPPDDLNFDKINLAASNDKDTRIQHESMYLAKGNFEVDSHDIYKNEMAMLVQEHKLIISKHEREINYLKDLLQQERNMNKLLTTGKQMKSSLKIVSSQIKKMRHKFIPIDISVGSEPGISYNNNESNKPRDCPIISKEEYSSPFLSPKGYKTPTKALNNNFIRDRTFPIAPTINHSTPEGIFCTGLDKEALKNTKKKQRKDAYYALTHNTLNDDKEESIDFTNLKKVFGSSKSAMKAHNSITSFDSHLTTPDFSNSFLMIHA